jgi:WD40 repeat protein/transcriptional regulator with XRE-family HTH domain
MPGAPKDPDLPDFRTLALRLRGRAGLTQRELAAGAGVSERAVQTWEAGLSYPSAPSLKRLIALYLARGAFGAGREREEAAALWAAALAEAPRLNEAFDPAWFAGLLAGGGAPAGAAAAGGPRRHDWGEAPAAGALHGRAAEREALAHWLAAERCRLVGVLGMGGVGKTALAAAVARELAPDFDCVYWRSLRNAPDCGEWLGGAILFISAQEAIPPYGEDARLRLLLRLLVLDNLETVLEPGAAEVGYRAGYAGFGAALRALGEAGHQSCLLVTGREQPPELGPPGGEQSPVRALRLGGLDSVAARALLADKGLVGDDGAWGLLVGRYGGNALALQVVAETVGAVFGGDIAAFLAEGEAVFGGIRRLLAAQLGRLSAAERAALDWLAVEREPVGFAQLAADLGPAVSRGEALEAVEALGRRSLLERGEGGGFTLQPVVLEHVTEEIIAAAAAEIREARPMLLVRHPLVKAKARDYVRRSQERLIAAPLLARLAVAGMGGEGEGVLLGLLEGWRGRPPAAQGYGPGNVVNLLRLRRGHLRGLDLSRLVLRQVYLADCAAQDTSLAGAELAEAALAEAFGGAVFAALSADAAFLAAGAISGELRVWRVGPVLAVAAHAGPVASIALSGDGRLAASGGFDGAVRLWETSSGKRLVALEGHTAAVWGVALSGDGRLLASGGADGMLRLWDTTNGECLAALPGHTAALSGVALSGDGRLAASAGADGTARLWETNSGRCFAVLEGHAAAVWGVALSGDGRLAASAGGDGKLRLWETAGGRCFAVLEGHHAAEVRGVALNGDGQLLASGGLDGVVRLWDTASGECLLTLEGHTAAVWGVALSGDGRYLATGGFDSTVRLWETRGRECLTVLRGLALGVASVALSGDGRLAASGGLDGAVRLWEASSGRCLAVLEGHSAGVVNLASSGDGRLLASGGLDGTVRLWETASGRCLAVLERHAAGVRGVAMSGDSRLLASGGADGAVRLWDTASGDCLLTLEGHAAGVWGVALSKDGRLAASGGLEGTVRLWETAGGRCLAVLEGHAAGVWDVALSGDGRLLASGGLDGTVRLWETASGRCLAVLEGHISGVISLASSGDGRLLASGGLDGTVRLWETTSGRCLAVLEGHGGEVWSVALTREGRLLASAGLDGTVRLWEVPGGAWLRTLRPDRPYERMDITGLTGVTDAQRAALFALGATERGAGAPSPVNDIGSGRAPAA